jgi:hypothetical protein
MTAQEYICISSYFSAVNHRNWAGWFWELARAYGKRLEVDLSDFVFETYDYAAFGGEKQMDDTAATAQLLAEAERGYVMKVGVSAAPDQVVHTLSPFTMWAEDCRRQRGYGIVYLQFAPDLLDDAATGLQLATLTASELGNGLDIRYGILHRMGAGDLPDAYFGGASMLAPTPQQEQELLEWDAKSPYFQSMIRDIYWGNFITDGHWQGDADCREQLLGELRAAAGADGTLAGEGLLFTAPSPLFADSWQDGLADFRDAAMTVLRRFGVTDMASFEVGEDTRFVAFDPIRIERDEAPPAAAAEPEPAPAAAAAAQAAAPSETVDASSIAAALAALQAEALPASEHPDGDGPIYPVITLEAFFDGNHDEGSIGGGLEPHPGLSTFHRVLGQVRERPGVDNVLVQVTDVIEDDPEVWPLFAQWVYVITDAPLDVVDSWVVDLRPEDIQEGLPFTTPPRLPAIPDGMTVYALWWD